MRISQRLVESIQLQNAYTSTAYRSYNRCGDANNGSTLISSLIVFPALTSMRVCKSFRGVIITSAVVSVVCFIAGLFVSYGFSTPAGASVVASNLVIFLLFSLAGLIIKKV